MQVSLANMECVVQGIIETQVSLCFIWIVNWNWLFFFFDEWGGIVAFLIMLMTISIFRTLILIAD